MPDWDPDEHPRWPAKTSRGGQFRAIGVPGIGGWIAEVAGRLTRGWANDEQSRRELEEIARDHPPLYEGELPEGVEHGLVVHHLSAGNTAEVWRAELPDGRSVVLKIYDSGGGDDDEEFEDWEYDNEEQRANHEALRALPSAQEVQSANAEVVASLIAEAIGAPVAPVVLDPSREQTSTVWMGWVDGDSRLSGHDFSGEDPASPTGRAAWLLGLLDLLVHNSDRHGYNYVVGDDGVPVGIDHGEVGLFAEGGMWPPDRGSDMHVSGPFAALYYTDNPLTGRQAPFLSPNALHPEDIVEARRRLRKLHGEGRFADDHLRYMERVLDLLEPHASGTRRLIP